MAKSSAKTYTASGNTPKTYNKGGEMRKNSSTKQVSGTVTARQLQRARRMGKAMTGARGRGSAISAIPGRNR